MMDEKSKRKNKSLALSILMLVAGMLMLSYAAVPLYRLFCQVTGFGGTTAQADVSTIPTETYDRKLMIRFNAVSFEGLPWEFKTLQNKQPVQVGENKLAFFTAENVSNVTTKGTATFNVTPHKVGQYFVKVECFCFEEQELKPGEKIEFPVSYYIDPKILNDEDAMEVTTITLSYTFFPVEKFDELVFDE